MSDSSYLNMQVTATTPSTAMHVFWSSTHQGQTKKADSSLKALHFKDLVTSYETPFPTVGTLILIW